MKLKDVYEEIAEPEGVEKFIKQLETELKRFEIDAEVMAGGSYAKGDYLNDPDIDIFVIFDQKYKDKNLSKLLEKTLSKFKPELVHGSRDYFHIGQFEIVPVLKIEKAEDAVNITDVSPLHVNWVNKHIKNMHDDIRLAKLFFKSAGVYGAESHVMGFSGYILELLTINYGGFDNLIKAISLWKPKVFVDPEQHYKDLNHANKTLSSAKRQSPLIVIDPVQPDRNASASVSTESFSNIILAANRYVLNPDTKFFRHHETTVKELSKNSKNRGTKLYIVEVLPLEGKTDISGSKLLKAFNYIKKQLRLNDFRIFSSGWSFNFLYFELYEDVLPKKRKHYGPLAWVQGSNMHKFLSKYEKINVEEDRLVVYIDRKFIKAKQFFEDVLAHEEVRLRVRGAKCLKK